MYDVVSCMDAPYCHFQMVSTSCGIEVMEPLMVRGASSRRLCGPQLLDAYQYYFRWQVMRPQGGDC